MYHVAGIVFAAHAVANLVHLVGAEVCHAAHPHAEAPQGRHRGVARKVAVAADNLLHRVAADEENVKHGLVAEELYRAR